MVKRSFQSAVLTWFDNNGRKTLPWQNPRTPYKVWISEVMLQQTQVQTVIPYFQRFFSQFPDVKSLAIASIDEVLQLWAGLGYYARARNLHQTARILQEDFAGQFPQDLNSLQKLPGIGRSTAGAILALGFNKKAAILDGNVKRIFCRLNAISEWPSKTEITKKLWVLAENYLPEKRIADYTQALMDIGSLVCKPRDPSCISCPMNTDCLAYQENNQHAFPGRKPSKNLPIRKIQMLIFCKNSNEILLEKRPPTGIWGGLWSLPECSMETEINQWSETEYFCQIGKIKFLPAFRHTFSHFHLNITPAFIPVKSWSPPLMESSSRVWYKVANIKNKGLAAPVKKLLKNLFIE